MKMRIWGLAMSLGLMAGAATADQVLKVDGEDYLLSDLLKNCQIVSEDAEAEIACVNTVSQLLAEQSGAAPEVDMSINEALDALRAVAQYQDDESGLLITGSFCTVQILYYNNFFHISRRNISTIDLVSAQFNASKLQYDRIVAVQGAQLPLLKGYMDEGTNAVMRGGVALDSGQDDFAALSPGMTMDVYANEIANALPSREGEAFDFVLVHPQRNAANAEIWSAFEGFVRACRS